MFGTLSAATVFHLRAAGTSTLLLLCLAAEASERLSLRDMIPVVVVEAQWQ
jgi:hypothetical protein